MSGIIRLKIRDYVISKTVGTILPEDLQLCNYKIVGALQCQVPEDSPLHYFKFSCVKSAKLFGFFFFFFQYNRF